MSSLHFTTILLLCHILIRVNGQSTTLLSSTTVPPTSTSTPSPTTSPPCEDVGAQVNITVYVRVSNCSGASHENVSSPEYRDLERNLKGNLTDFYTRDGVNYALTIILQTTQCMGNYVKVVVTINFKLGIGFNIEEDIKTEVSDNSLVSLPVNGNRTLLEVLFIDVGAQVNITIYVGVSNCSGASHENVSSPEYRDLETILKGNFTDFYTRDRVNYVLIIALQTTQCMGNYVKVVVTITFKLGIGFNIEEDIRTEVSDNSLDSLPVNGTLVEVAFICQSTSSILPSSITVSPTSISIPSTNTSPAGEGQSNYSTSMLMSAVSMSPTSTFTIASSSSTSSPSDGQSNYSTSMLMSAVSMSPTSTFTIASSSSTSSPSDGEGTKVNITIYVNVSNCNGASYEDVERNLEGNLTNFYKRDGVNNALTIILRTVQCTANFVEVVATITFKLEIEFKIVEDIKKGTSNNYLVGLPVDGSRVEVAFIGVKITFEIKDGECKRVCCNGAGGPVVMVSSCSLQDGDNRDKCQGFKPEEKQEGDHCPGEAKDLCSSTCDSSEGDRGSVQCPSFVLLGILAVATFLK